MKNIEFTPIAWEEYETKIIPNKAMLKKVNTLIKDIARGNVSGKAERLKHDFFDYSSCCSRRIDSQNRIVYLEQSDRITIVRLIGHYEDK